MAKEQTDKSRFPSKYSPKQFVTPVQYIIELLAEAKARSEGRALPIKFWVLPEWATFYKSQLRAVNKLVKVKNPLMVIDFLKKNNKLYSLNAKWAKDKLEQFSRKWKPPIVPVAKPVMEIELDEGAKITQHYRLDKDSTTTTNWMDEF